MNIEKWIEENTGISRGIKVVTLQDLRALFAGKALVPVESSPQAAVQQPIASVTGYHGGHCVIEPIDRAQLLHVGMALYSGAHKMTDLEKQAELLLIADLIKQSQAAIIDKETK